MKTWKRWAALAVAAAALPALLTAGALDGTQWQSVKKNGKPIKGEILRFESGQLTSEGCIPYGFTPSSYQENAEGNALSWSATQTNPKGEKMQWQGSSTGDKMEGTSVWTKANGKSARPKKWMAKKIS